MFQKAIHFIKYHNAFAIGVSLIFVFMIGAFAASPDLRENLISSQETVQSVDNSGILAANLDNFDFSLQIKEITQDESNYYIAYIYKTIAIQDYIWQEVEKENTLTVSKEALGNRDLGLYVAEELGEVVDYELSYLKMVQQIEKEKGLTQKIVATQYAGLIGRFLSPEEKVFQGYQPVVQEPLVAQPETIEEYTPTQLLEPTEQLTTEQQMPIDKELIRQMVQEILSQQQTQFAEQPAACQPEEEICDDGIDNDCDGIVDNPDICQAGAATTSTTIPTTTPTTTSECRTQTFYLDSDNDNYGDQANSITTCEQPAGYITDNTDCNDSDPNINPGATEVCGDGIDNNCNSTIDESCEVATTSDFSSDSDTSTVSQTTASTTASTTETYTGQTPNQSSQGSNGTGQACASSTLEYCTSTEACVGAGGFWYNNICNAAACVPNWQCTEWQPAAETVACGQEFTQTCANWIDNNNCGFDQIPTTTQQAIGTDSAICGITSCKASKNLTGECQNTCVAGACQICTPVCVCAEGFSDCDNNPTNGCETASSTCPTL